MIKLNVRVFIWLFVASAGLQMFVGAAKASAIVGFNATVTGIPTIRVGGASMAPTEIEGFRVFSVSESGLEALTPDIVYNQGVDATGNIFMSTDVPAGEVDLCVMTVDTFGRLSDCNDAVPVAFEVPLPGVPGGATFAQSVTFNLTISGN